MSRNEKLSFAQHLALMLGHVQNQRPAILWDKKGGMLIYNIK